MTLEEFARGISLLPVDAKTGVAAIYGDRLPQEIPDTVGIESATVIDSSLLLHFTSGCLVTILNPTDFWVREERIIISSCDFLRIESHRMPDDYFLFEYSIQSNMIHRLEDGGDLRQLEGLTDAAFVLDSVVE